LVAAIDFLPEAAFYVTGGTVPHGAPSYVERAADAELYQALRAGEFSYVLNSRQMGKSSLAVRTINRLAQDGIACAFVDLTKLGGGATQDQWYAGLLVETGRAIGLRNEAAQYVREHRELGGVQNYLGFLTEVVLAKIQGPVVLMIDEIDAVRSLSFSTDDLFAGIRQLHNGRASNPELSRLAVCLLGAALPSDLIKDPRSTPFNVGVRVNLRDFTDAEAAVLAPGLGASGDKIVSRVMYWTGGHPFLTQALCARLAKNATPSVAEVDRLVRSTYLDARARESDTNLVDVANRLLGRGDPDVTDLIRADTLTHYQRLLRRDLTDDESDASTARIKMSGVVRGDSGRLKIRNRIYGQIFDRAWVRAKMPGAEVRRQRRAYWLGALRTGVVAALLLVIVSALAALAVRGAREARRATAVALRAQADAQRAAGAESEASRLARIAAKQAEDANAKAQRNLTRAIAAESSFSKAAIQEHSLRLQEEQLTEFARKNAVAASASEAKALERLYESDMARTGDAATYGSGVEMNELISQTPTAGIGPNQSRWEYAHFRALLHEAHELPQQTHPVTNLAFTSAGHLLVRTQTEEVRAYDVSHARMLADYSGLDSVGILGRQITPDGNLLINRLNGDIEIRDPETSRLVHIVKIGTPVFGLRASDDGRRLVGQLGGVSRIFNLQTGQIAPPQTYDVGTDESIYPLPDGDLIEKWDEGVERLDASGKHGDGAEWFAQGFFNSQRALATSPHGEYVAFSDSYGRVQVLNAVDGSRLGPPIRHSSIVFAIAFSPDDETIASGTEDGVIKLSRARDGALIRMLRCPGGLIQSLAFSPSGELAYGCFDGRLGVFDLSDFGAPSGQLRAGSDFLANIAVSPDGSRFATSPSSGRVETIYDAHTGKKIDELRIPMRFPQASFSPDGKILAVGGSNEDNFFQGFVVLFDTVNRKSLTFTVPNTPLPVPTFLPDGRHFILANGASFIESRAIQSSLSIWDVVSGKLIRSIPEGPGFLRQVALSTNGKYAVLPRDGNVSQLCDARNLSLIHELRTESPRDDLGDDAYAYSSAFSPDSREVLLGRANGKIDVYSVATGVRVAGWAAHTGRVIGLKFSPDGQTLISACDDGKIKMWTTGGWRNVGTVAYPNGLFSFAVSKSDGSVYVGDQDGLVHALRIRESNENLHQVASFKIQNLVTNPSAESWDAARFRARREGKSIFVAGYEGYSAFERLLREETLDPEFSKIVKKYFILFDSLPDEKTQKNGQKISVAKLDQSLFPSASSWPQVGIFDPSGRQTWQGRARNPFTKQLEDIGAPAQPYEVSATVAALSRWAPKISDREASILLKSLADHALPYLAMDRRHSELTTLENNFRQLITEDRPSQALGIADKLVEALPMNTGYWGDRGQALAGLGRWSDAVHAFNAADGRVRPVLVGHFIPAQACVLMSGDFNGYRKRLESVIERVDLLSPDEAATVEFTAYGLTADSSDDPKATADRLARKYPYQVSNPLQVRIQGRYALVLLRAGRLKEAERHVRISLDPSTLLPKEKRGLALNRMTLALILAKEGNLAAARREYSFAESVFTTPRSTESLIGALGKNLPDNDDNRAIYKGSLVVYAIVRRECAALLGITTPPNVQ
jgi:WD40 repeat protein/tetratricopeptide (TPR) repeat protein